ncbi:MAG: acylphosphatase [Nitrospiraceae bacterium]|nr:MAG: acylphosphatase [Nitrospiraceae bacterium]
MEKGRVHLIVEGYVQGVFFRAGTRDTALRLGLTGWVRNVPDGNVEAVFEGPVENLAQAIKWCRMGPAGARVIKVKEKWEDYRGEFKGFDIRYSY